MDIVHRAVAARGWGEGGRAQRIFKTEKRLCMILYNSRYIHLRKPIGGTTSRMNASVKVGP